MEIKNADLKEFADICELLSRLIDYKVLNVDNRKKTSRKLMHIRDSIYDEDDDIFRGGEDRWQNIT